MSAIRPFLFEGEMMVRVMDREGEPWFVHTDACKVLGIGNASDAARRLDEDEKGVGSVDTPGGSQELIVISESGLYTLILTSRKPEAKRFKKWITAEVLPSIRKTGSYVLPERGGEPDGKPQPYDEWTLEQRRTAIGEVNCARHTLNQAAAAWMWGRVGLPLPPRHLLPAWWQADMDFRHAAGRSVTITVPVRGEPH